MEPGGRTRTPVVMERDRNFDDLAPRFARNIYGGHKGAIRLAVLRKDFDEFVPHLLQPQHCVPLRILDAGGGQGQFALQLAAAGHHVTLCDISEKMLDLARANAVLSNSTGLEFVHCSIAQMSAEVVQGKRAPFDVLICHAVLEWVAQQKAFLELLRPLLCDRGLLSLTFYNRHGLVIKNLLRGKRSTVLDGQFRPRPGSLTPHRPLDPQQVLGWLESMHWQLLCHSGIRVFHDYLLSEEARKMPADELLATELELSRQEPYRSMGRYQHVLARRLCAGGQTE